MQRITLIEDELFVRDLYERVLKQAGFEIVSAADGEAGWQLVKDQSQKGEKSDLILLDIMMPKLNGIEVLRRLKDDINLFKGDYFQPAYYRIALLAL